MTTEHIASLIGISLSALGSLFAFLKSRENGRQIAEIHVIINSRMTELLESTRNSAMYKERGEKSARDRP